MSRLYHYTCPDAYQSIVADGQLNPHPIPGVIAIPGLGKLDTGMGEAPAVVWLTDLDYGDKDRLGLHSTLGDCDRTAHRLEVDVAAVRWKHFARLHGADRHWLRTLHRYGDPFHWFVAVDPVAVTS